MSSRCLRRHVARICALLLLMLCAHPRMLPFSTAVTGLAVTMSAAESGETQKVDAGACHACIGRQIETERVVTHAVWVMPPRAVGGESLGALPGRQILRL